MRSRKNLKKLEENYQFIIQKSPIKSRFQIDVAVDNIFVNSNFSILNLSVVAFVIGLAEPLIKSVKLKIYQKSNLIRW